MGPKILAQLLKWQASLSSPSTNSRKTTSPFLNGRPIKLDTTGFWRATLPQFSARSLDRKSENRVIRITEFNSSIKSWLVKETRSCQLNTIMSSGNLGCVIVAVDGSEESMSALRWALDNLKLRAPAPDSTAGGSFVILHVQSPPSIIAGLSPGAIPFGGPS